MWTEITRPNYERRGGNGTAVDGLALGRQYRTCFYPARRSFAETGAGCGNTLVMIRTIGHIKSHLLVGDGFPRHAEPPYWSKRSPACRATAASTYFTSLPK